MKGAIHQPNFFPWLGFFNKISRCDVFILLDNAQGNRQTYSNRVQMLVNNKAHWITAPVQKIKTEETATFVFQKNSWREKRIKKTLSINYSKCPHFKEYKDYVFDLVNFPEDDIAKFNFNAIKGICSLLKIDEKKIVLSSNLNVNTASTERLVQLLIETNCDTYIQGGGGSEDYQDDVLFETHGIAIEKQNFRHPIYPQENNKGDFIKGLSILDALFNCGADKTKAFVEG